VAGPGAVSSLDEEEGAGELSHAGQVLRHPRFLALFLSQILTQVGGNMVLYGLTIQVFSLSNGASTSVSLLLLTFLVPAVVFGAVAGVFVDRYDRRTILVGTNIARGLLFLPLIFLDNQIVLIYVVTAMVATLTTFFAPAESAMIPIVVPRNQLLTANGIFIFALQASFVVGFAVLGPLATNLLGVQTLIAFTVGFYLLAGLLCWVLPAAPPSALEAVTGDALESAERAIKATGSQLREGLSYIRHHHNVLWSLTYLAITSSLIGVLGVLGPAFATKVLGLGKSDFVIIVLPLGAGLVLGIVMLNAYGRFVTRRRLIEGGLGTLSIALLILGLAQPVSGITGTSSAVPLLTVVIAVAFTAGIAYAFVAVPSQTALQEELPSDVRGRVFGVLNMLVSLASFLPIILVGPIADSFGTPAVIVASAVVIAATGLASYFLGRGDGATQAGGAPGYHLEPVDPLTVTTSSTLTRPVSMRYIDDGTGEHPIQYMATPVVPGKAGPAAGEAKAGTDTDVAADAPGGDGDAAAGQLVH
jgi:MFS family permease